MRPLRQVVLAEVETLGRKAVLVALAPEPKEPGKMAAKLVEVAEVPTRFCSTITVVLETVDLSA